MRKFIVRAWEDITLPRLMDITVEAKDCKEIVDALHKGKLDDLAVDWNEIHASWEAMRSLEYSEIESIEPADDGGACGLRMPVFADPTEKMLIAADIDGSVQIMRYSPEREELLKEDGVAFVVLTRGDMRKIMSFS